MVSVLDAATPVYVHCVFVRMCYHTKLLVTDVVLSVARGHNELDDPSFTQPLMYKAIASRPSVPDQYWDNLGVSLFHVMS